MEFVAAKEVPQASGLTEMGVVFGGHGLTKAEASEGAALIDACAPHGRAMLTQAQKRLEQLEAIKTLEKLARSTFGTL